MNDPRKALVLIGSPKKGWSASKALAEFVADGLREKGMQVQVRNVLQSLQEDRDGLFEDGLRVDLIVLSFPLHVDSLPAAVIEWMELMPSTDLGMKRSFVAIGQCGNPDAAQLDIALDILRNFCRAKGMNWLGGFQMGMGLAYSNDEKLRAKGVTRHAVPGLIMAFDPISKGEDVPEEALDTFSKRPMPTFMYVTLANRMWKKEAKRHGARKRMMDRPFS